MQSIDQEVVQMDNASKYTTHHVLGKVAGRLICSLTLTDPRVFEQEYLKEIPRPYILVMNHYSSWDPVLIWGYYPDSIRFLIKEELHAVPGLASISQLVGNIPVKRDHFDFKAMKMSLSCLKEGFNLGIFAEGTRSSDGSIKAFNPSVIALANKARVPLVPVYLHGTSEVCPIGSLMPKAGPTSIHILEPFTGTIEGNLDRDSFPSVAQSLQAIISDKRAEVLSRPTGSG